MSGELEKELREGLVGVTPGPWHTQDVSLGPDDVGSVYIVAANLGGLVGAAHSWPTEVDAGDFERAEANAKHMARCSPENIAKLLDTLATERAAREKAERETAERCAKIAENLPGQRGNSPEHLVGRSIASAIRAEFAASPLGGDT